MHNHTRQLTRIKKAPIVAAAGFKKNRESFVARHQLKTFLIICLSAGAAAFADVPDKFDGVWNIRAETAPGFPWWDNLKYPVELSVTNDGAIFEDQAGSTCTPKAFFYDDELDALVFKHCGVSKSETAFALFYRIKVDSDVLAGEVWTHKLMFRLKGERVGSR